MLGSIRLIDRDEISCKRRKRREKHKERERGKMCLKKVGEKER